MEKAARECQPAERPAMLRRWLAALRMQEGWHDTPNDRPGAPGRTPGKDAAAETPVGTDAAEGEGGRATAPGGVDGAPTDAAAALTAGAAAAADQFAPPSPDQDWDSLNLEKSESRDAAQAGADQDSATVGGGANASKYGLDDAMRNSRLFFYEEGSDEPLTFRDVVLRSRTLEHLVNSYVAVPCATAVEASLLTEIFTRLLMGGEVTAAALADGLAEVGGLPPFVSFSRSASLPSPASSV